MSGRKEISAYSGKVIRGRVVHGKSGLARFKHAITSNNNNKRIISINKYQQNREKEKEKEEEDIVREDCEEPATTNSDRRGPLRTGARTRSRMGTRSEAGTRSKARTRSRTCLLYTSPSPRD